MIDFFGSGCDAAERLGLLPDLAAIHYQIDRLTFVDLAGRARFSVAYLPLRKRLLADRHFNFLRRDLERGHLRAIRTPRHSPVRHQGHIIQSQQVDGYCHAVTERHLHDLVGCLVGTDGVHSHVRRLAFGDEKQFARPLGYDMAAFTIDRRLSSAFRRIFSH